MERVGKGQFKPEFIKKPKVDLPFESINGQWFLKNKIRTRDYINGKTGFELDPTGNYSKINSYGGNVHLYDAVVAADGSAEFKEIQDAINAGRTNIFVRSGTYWFKDDYRIVDNDIHIVGENKSDTIFKIHADFSGGSAILAIGDAPNSITVSNIIIENITFDGNRTVYTSAMDVLFISSVNDLQVINCNFIDSARSGISTSNHANADNKKLWISNCYFTNSKIGIYLYGSSGVETVDWLITNNYISSAGTLSWGIYLEYCNDSIISNNIILSQYSAILIKQSRRNIISNNNLRSSARHGIEATQSHFLNINGNQIHDCDRHGINLGGCQYNNIINNIFYNNGVETDDTYSDIILNTNNAVYCLYNIINNNQINAASDVSRTKYGYRESNSSQDYNLIANNIVVGHTGTTISIQGANTIIGDNIY